MKNLGSRRTNIPKALDSASDGGVSSQRRESGASLVEQNRKEILGCLSAHNGLTVPEILDLNDLPHKCEKALRELLNVDPRIEAVPKERGKYPHIIRYNVYILVNRK